MDIALMTLIVWVGLLALMATGFPVAFSMLGISAAGYVFFVGPQAFFSVFSGLYKIATTDVFIACPMFLFMASLLQVSGMGNRLYAMMYQWMGGLRGGLAMGTVFICTIIAATTGLAGTGVIMMGLLAYPEMMKRGYNKDMATGCIPVGGALGPIIPPSVPMILVGTWGGLSVGKLFMAGVFPGILASIFFMAYIAVRCYFNPKLGPGLPASERAPWNEKLKSLAGVLAPLFLIILVLGGIYSGACTASEAGGIGALGAMIVAAGYGNLTWKNLRSAMMTTVRVEGMIGFITIGGVAFSQYCGITGVTHFISDLLAGLPSGPYGILAVMMIVLLILGMFIDSVAIIMICLPVMLPTATSLGFDALWFGFIFTLAVVIGMITPPFGYNLFYMQALGLEDLTIKDIYRAVIPYIPLFILVLFLCIVFPELAMYLPNKMLGK